MAVLSLAGTSTYAQQPPKTYPRDSVIFGSTYSDWSAGWQQWSSSMPSSAHPLFDSADCSKGQSGPVWFLGGGYASSNVERSCTIPQGKALYFPIINIACFGIEAEKGYCGPAGPYIPQMRAYLADVIDLVTDLKLVVDGKALKGDLKNQFRVQSPVHTVTVPDSNLLQFYGETIGAGTYWSVDDGVYIMLEPLAPGDHTINFQGSIPSFNFNLDITYHLTVQ